MSAAPWEIRLAHLEGAYEQVSQRLSGIEGRLGRVEAKIDEHRTALTAKIDEQRTELTAKIDEQRTELTAKMDEQRTELTAKIDEQRTELGGKIDRLRSDQHSQFRWVIGLIVVSILLPFAGRFVVH